MSEKIRDSFIFYRSFFQSTKRLSKEDKAELFDAICSYALDGELIELSAIPDAIFSVIQPNLDANRRRWENGCKEKKKPSEYEAGEKRSGSKTEAKQKQTLSKAEANKDKDKDVNVNKDDIKEISSLREDEKNKLEKDFEEFWESYMPIVTNDGKKVDKGSKKLAKISYAKARKIYDADTIYNGAAQYLADCYRNNRLSCQVSVCLNQERFINDFNAPTLQVKSSKKYE